MNVCSSFFFVLVMLYCCGRKKFECFSKLTFLLEIASLSLHKSSLVVQ